MYTFSVKGHEKALKEEPARKWTFLEKARHLFSNHTNISREQAWHAPRHVSKVEVKTVQFGTLIKLWVSRRLECRYEMLSRTYNKRQSQFVKQINLWVKLDVKHLPVFGSTQFVIQMKTWVIRTSLKSAISADEMNTECYGRVSLKDTKRRRTSRATRRN